MFSLDAGAVITHPEPDHGFGIGQGVEMDLQSAAALSVFDAVLDQIFQNPTEFICITGDKAGCSRSLISDHHLPFTRKR